MNTSLRSDECGFTLIEVLVSIVILSTGIILVLGAMETSASALSAARTMSRSVFLCEQQLAALALEDAGEGGQSLDTESGSFDSPYEQFRWTREVAVDPGASDGLDRVRAVRISISRAGQDTDDIQFTTLVAE